MKRFNMLDIDFEEEKKENISKEQLLCELKRYKKLISSPLYDYLNSLIELELSAIKDYYIDDKYIGDEEKIILSEWGIYKSILNYNIVNRALNIINSKSDDINALIKNESDRLRIYAEIDRTSYMLFSYDLIESDRYSENDVGRISLYQTINSKDQIEKEINRLTELLDTLYNKKNPFVHYEADNVFGGPAAYWRTTLESDIYLYENKLKKLQSKTCLTENDEKEIEITSMIHELILEDYGLTNDSFILEKDKKAKIEMTELYKTYIKTMPKVTIKNNIKYI